MRHLLNTLYILSDDIYLTLDGENVVAKKSGSELGRVPLHTLESILSFSYAGASPALMGKCADAGIELAFFKPSNGRFLADVAGVEHGNVLLRSRQYKVANDSAQSLEIARKLLIGKLFNSKWVLERCLRDHQMRVDAGSIKRVSEHLSQVLSTIRASDSLASLRGIEGDAAACYFSVFNELILNVDPTFIFAGRSKRPPRDAINAMLSLFYTMLSLDCSSALRGVGLDPFVGFFHVNRPGRRSLALDCMEELRAVLVDRFVLTCVNNRIVGPMHFDKKGSGEVFLNDKGRKTMFDAWQKKKREQIKHPYLEEKVPWGLVPFIQAQLLAKYLRCDIDGYPPFLWK
ncbi:type I-C CRISPR-associated endonuclease Cas1 [Coriobacteriales bacterium OH1046]|nr:type I-C CRISPR-associated endonuclease Cas1 [Coriobacteriales bacterium OH1046]